MPVDADGSEHFQSMDSQPPLQQKGQTTEIGTFNHSRHIGNATFAKDLCEKLIGDLDRTIFPARKLGGDGKLWLIPIVITRHFTALRAF